MRQLVPPDGIAAVCETAGGRRRRARVEECVSVTAEGVYAVMLRDARWMVHPGATGELRWIVDGRAHQVAWEVRANRLWRFGRLFLTCPACGGRMTRIYVPTIDVRSPACRLCWRLNYQSQASNYKNGGLLKDVGLTSRTFARRETWLKRRCARAAARARWAARRTLWTPPIAGVAAPRP